MDPGVPRRPMMIRRQASRDRTAEVVVRALEQVTCHTASYTTFRKEQVLSSAGPHIPEPSLCLPSLRGDPSPTSTSMRSFADDEHGVALVIGTVSRAAGA